MKNRRSLSSSSGQDRPRSGATPAGRLLQSAGAGPAPDSSDAVMQTVERRTLQLLEAPRDEPAQPGHHSIESVTESNVEAMSDQMSATKAVSVRDQFVERETDGGVVCGNDGSGARADDDVDGNLVGSQLSKDAKMTGSTQSPAAQHDANANRRAFLLGQGAVGESGDVGLER